MLTCWCWNQSVVGLPPSKHDWGLPSGRFIKLDQKPAHQAKTHFIRMFTALQPRATLIQTDQASQEAEVHRSGGLNRAEVITYFARSQAQRKARATPMAKAPQPAIRLHARVGGLGELLSKVHHLANEGGPMTYSISRAVQQDRRERHQQASAWLARAGSDGLPAYNRRGGGIRWRSSGVSRHFQARCYLPAEDRISSPKVLISTQIMAESGESPPTRTVQNINKAVGLLKPAKQV